MNLIIIKGLSKRWSPFNASINVIYWVSRIVKWIYHQTDMIPYRIQNRVNREYTILEDAEFEIKHSEADDKVKIVIAKEFPEFYKKKYLDPFDEGSELFEENKHILERSREGGGRVRREFKVERGGGLETRSMEVVL